MTLVKFNEKVEILIQSVCSISKINLKKRKEELSVCKKLIEKQVIAFKQAFKERKVELAMS